MAKSVKRRVFEIMEKGLGDDRDLPSRTFEVSIMALIALNVVAVALGTVGSLRARYGALFQAFETFSVAVFTAEYLARMWSCASVPAYAHPIKGRLRFALTPMAMVDLAAILPFYMPMILPVDLRVVRAIRLVRLFKLGRYSDSLRTLGGAIRAKKHELSITVFVVFVLLVISSSLMYFVENRAQPEAFSSIPAAMWWAVSTLTTVGYGDMYPVTVLGKLLGALISLLGIATFALPAGIIASGFAQELQRRFRRAVVCPHCGREVGAESEEEPVPGPQADEAAAHYRPRPLDVSGVEVPAELCDLVERLAGNVHEVWAAQRMAEGWVYGRQRNESALTHPDLVPYSELPEPEKDYDRSTVEGVLKAMLALDYRVQPPPG
ncbi:MAG: ion transporter [Candidatus Brocadiaceae bacterium]|jgi:voltage-gated potassium channel